MFKDEEVDRLNRDHLKDKLFLRKDHHDRLSREEGGVIRPINIAISNLYSTFDEEEILDIYTDGDSYKKSQHSCKTMASQLAHTGVMVIPYAEFKGDLSNVGDRNWRRMRTDKVKGKYLSPLGGYSPPYRVLGFDDPEMLEICKKTIIDEIKEELPGKEKRVDLVSEHVLDITNFDEVKKGTQNNKLPIIVVEGEFKALAIFDAWLDKQKEYIKKGVETDDLESYILELNPIDNFTCVGIGGVWNMIKKGEDKSNPDNKYIVRPEWEDSINLKDRPVLICFDSDSKWIPSVGHAASCLAKAVEPYGAEISYIQIPSPRGKKFGADDYIQEYGYEKFLETIENAEKIAAGVRFNEIVAADAKGISSVDYLIEQAKNLEVKMENLVEKDNSDNQNKISIDIDSIKDGDIDL